MKNAISGKVYRAAIYVRLSKEDADKDVSDSIVNQKDLIYDFLSGRADIEPVGEFVDDGYSGVDFERPAFLRLLKDIEATYRLYRGQGFIALRQELHRSRTLS